MHAPPHPETGLPDWDAKMQGWIDSGAKEDDPAVIELRKDTEFIKAHFVPLRQPGDAFDWSMYQDMETYWLTCTAFKGGKCTEYANRPKLCRIFLCDPVIDTGVNPDLAIEMKDGKLVPMYFYPGTYDLNRMEDGLVIDTNFVRAKQDSSAFKDASRLMRAEIIDRTPKTLENALKRAGLDISVPEYVEEFTKVIAEAKAKKAAEKAADKTAVEDALAILAKLDKEQTKGEE